MPELLGDIKISGQKDLIINGYRPLALVLASLHNTGAMRLNKLTVQNFGPFRSYTVYFNLSDPACLLITGKNNEGKSHLLFALHLVHAALKVVGRKRHLVYVKDSEGFGLLKQDIGDLTIGRLVHNYEDHVGKITATFGDGFQVTVYLDPINEIIYASSVGKRPADADKILGIMPPLGQLAASEDRLSEPHVKASLNTTLAPRHFRNHLIQILSEDECQLVEKIITESWDGIEFIGASWDWKTRQIDAFYREGRIDREVSWAGQGLQVWFQIVAHMVRLRGYDLLILDEPEINLHAEKQHDLVRLLREYHPGSVLIATHSVELMNDVGVSHIIHVRKNTTGPTIKSTDDRAYLELVRSSVGSNFNLVASQFEAVDLILFTEDRSDFKIIDSLAKRLGIQRRLFSIPLHGFSEYPKAISYREAYQLLIGRNDTDFTVLLDRDYYPPVYLEQVQRSLEKDGIQVVFTPGKELENLFLDPNLIEYVLGQELYLKWNDVWAKVCSEQRVEAIGSGITLYSTFVRPKPDDKTIYMRVSKRIDDVWGGPSQHKVVPGKVLLGTLRQFYRQGTGSNLSDQKLLDALVEVQPETTRHFLHDVLQTK